MQSNKKSISRRCFLTASAAAGLFAGMPTIVPSRVLGKDAPSNRIVVACIGLGGQGTQNLRAFMNATGVQVAAVCDCDRRHLEAGLSIAGLKAADGTMDFRTLIARDDIDVIVNSTPDHWHVPISLAAVNAGKDVFCEKPLTLTIAEGRRLADAADRYGRILQTGTQQRSDRYFRQAVECVWNQRLGRLKRIEIEIPANGVPNPIDWKPQPVPEGFDYAMWLGSAPWAPYTKQRCHWYFRFISDYSGGQMTNWGSHHLDIAQWALQTDHSGPVHIEGRGEIPADGLFDTPDHMEVVYTYADGVQVICRTGEPSRRGYSGLMTFTGTDGWLEVTRGMIEASNPQILYEPLGANEKRAVRSDDHTRDFLDAVKTRRKPMCDAHVGHRSSTICHLGVMAIQLARPLRWDPAAECFVEDAAANRLLDRPARSWQSDRKIETLS